MQCVLLAQSDGGLISAAREPGFQVWAVYALVAYLIGKEVLVKPVLWLVNYLEKKKAREVNVQQPLEVRAAKEHADKAEVDKQLGTITSKLDDLGAKVDQQRSDVMEVIARTSSTAKTDAEKRVAALVKEIDDVEKRIDLKLDAHAKEAAVQRRDLHDKCNNAINLATAHGATLPQLDKRLSTVETNLHDGIDGVHKRIDDCMKKPTRS